MRRFPNRLARPDAKRTQDDRRIHNFFSDGLVFATRLMSPLVAYLYPYEPFPLREMNVFSVGTRAPRTNKTVPLTSPTCAPPQKSSQPQA